ncbi:MAG: hypothetical protein AD073_000209 [Mycoplasmataceae bacterium]|nr:MAG: hypothetical protein AD073_000209 [Mycoplasmataceae bacterium]
MELFFSLITEFIFISLFDNGKLVKSIYERNHRMHSENFIQKLRFFLEEIDLNLRDIDFIFFVSGPGSQTGERVATAFVITMKALKSNLKVFYIDSLTFQAGLEDNFLSVVSVGENTKKYFLTVFLNGKLFLKSENLNQDNFDEIKNKFKNLNLFYNFERTSFLENFLVLKDKFLAFEGFE